MSNVQQLQGFLVGKTIRSIIVERDSMIIVFGPDHGRVVLSGHFRVDMQNGNLSTDVLDVEAKISSKD